MKIIHFLILFLLLTSPLYAYLDPGSGSMLLYALLGILTTLLYSLKNVYYRGIQWLTGRKTIRHVDLGNSKIVFHSEGGKYWNVFKPIIDALLAQDESCTYITPDAHDPAIAYAQNNFIVKHFDTEMQCILFMNQISAPLVVSTTPQLDVYMLHRSSKVSHYCHVIHAPTDVLVYKKFAFDFYDSVLCAGPHQIEHIRLLEAHRKTTPKLLLKTGCTYFDHLTQTFTDNIQNPQQYTNPRKTILFAPTWGASSAITQYQWDIFEVLLALPYDIIFRPHPQLYVSQRELISPMLAKLKDYPHVSIDNNSDASESFFRADLLISDISGVIFDFSFLHQKPIVLLDVEIKAKGYEADGIIPYDKIWEYRIRRDIALIVEKNKLDTLPEIIRNIFGASDDESTHKARMIDIRNKYIYNFGASGEIAAKQLLKIYNDL